MVKAYDPASSQQYIINTLATFLVFVGQDMLLSQCPSQLSCNSMTVLDSQVVKWMMMLFVFTQHFHKVYSPNPLTPCSTVDTI